MAIMFDCAIDWTFDLAYADAKKAKPYAMPHGVRASKNESEGVKLFRYLKTIVKFENERLLNEGYRPYDNPWRMSVDWDFVSDWYKDVYGQRPHFNMDYWCELLADVGAWTNVGMHFCCDLVADRIAMAKYNRSVALSE